MAVADGALNETPAEDSAAPATPPLPQGPVATFVKSKQGQRISLIVAAAVVIALMIGVWMWSQKVEYRVLFSNFSDRDGGAIVASLQQMNIPYKFSDSGNAILVPEAVVHDARLKLAAQGLPKGGNVGFELMENQKLGISQFLEQVNFQRALEGELARSIESLDSVAGARVHLALPKASVFVRDQQKPTASVILNLRPGRVLDDEQVSAIVHLVASSVPELPPKGVTIIDQNGNLLSSDAKKANRSGLDPTQLKYVQDVQSDIVKRVESIISPIVGAGNVRAEATADIDFSHTEQAAEVYKPNQAPNTAAIRSQQTAETSNPNAAAAGIPGALTNQPPAPATAPIVQPVPGGPGAAPATASTTVQKDATTNYEVDKTVSYVQQPMVGVKRLTVAVVVNYKRVYAANGSFTLKPLSDAEKTQITELVREAMGYNKDRGDSLNVVNTLFSAEPDIQPPLWKQPRMIDLALLVGKYLLVFIVLMLLYFRLLRPIIWKLTGKTERDALAKAQAEAEAKEAEEEAERLAADPDAIVQLSGAGGVEGDFMPAMSYKENLEIAKAMAKRDPRLVASVIKGWVNNE